MKVKLGSRQRSRVGPKDPEEMLREKHALEKSLKSNWWLLAVGERFQRLATGITVKLFNGSVRKNG